MIFDEWWIDYGIEQASIAEKSAARKGWQAGAASRDADVSNLKQQVSHMVDMVACEKSDADYFKKERDQLREHVEMLRIALFVIQDNSDDIGVIERAIEALEKTEPK